MAGKKMQGFSADTLWLYQNLPNFACLFQCIIRGAIRKKKIHDAYIFLETQKASSFLSTFLDLVLILRRTHRSETHSLNLCTCKDYYKFQYKVWVYGCIAGHLCLHSSALLPRKPQGHNTYRLFIRKFSKTTTLNHQPIIALPDLTGCQFLELFFL